MISISPSKSFLAAEPTPDLVADLMYVFAVQRSPVLADLDDEGENLVILCNGSDVAALYRRAARLTRAWQRLIQWLPYTPRDVAVRDVREMDQWLFERRSAASIIDRISVRNSDGRAFLEEVGARLFAQDDREAVYLTTGAVH